LSAHTYLDKNSPSSKTRKSSQLIETVLHVVLNTWTNFINVVGATDIDFPVVTAGKFN
jgi:hypothetical protein